MTLPNLESASEAPKKKLGGGEERVVCCTPTSLREECQKIQKKIS